LGAVISISGGLLPEFMESHEDCEALRNNASLTTKNHELPIHVSHGTQDDQVPIAVARKNFDFLRSAVGSKENMIWKEYPKQHCMIASQQETKDIMAFFSAHLHLRNVALESRDDIVEVKL